MYCLYFGDFVGFISKWLYFVFGVMLIMFCVLGMEIWLFKKVYLLLVSRFWYSMVWGSVSVFVLIVVVDMFFIGLFIVVFWCFMLFNIGIIVGVKLFIKLIWLFILGLSVMVLFIVYVVVY